jgi:hypothetical protein
MQGKKALTIQDYILFFTQTGDAEAESLAGPCQKFLVPPPLISPMAGLWRGAANNSFFLLVISWYLAGLPTQLYMSCITIL